MSSTTLQAERKSLEPWIRDDIEFYPFQIDGIRHLAKQRPNWLLGDDMGLGKSLQALTVFAIDVVMEGYTKMLVVCPATLKGNWLGEIEEHTGFSVTVLGFDPTIKNKTGRPKILTKADRSAQISSFAIQDFPRILICNYEQVAGHLDELNCVGFDVRCFDEAHYLKNPKSKRTQACLKLKSKRAFLLSGTFMLNQVNELWTPLHIWDSKQFPSYWRFVNRYCLFGGYEGKQIVGVKNNKELTDKLAQAMLRRENSILGWEKPHRNIIRVDLHPEQREVYDQLAEEDFFDFKGVPTPAQIEHAVVKFGLLKQICGTLACREGYPDVSAKLDRAIEVVEELTDAGEKVVVFTQFRSVLACFQQRMARTLNHVPLTVIHGDVPQDQRIPLVTRWGGVAGASVAALMLQVGAVGLNMQAAHHVVFLDKLFVPKLNDQALARCIRIGQQHRVIAHEIIARNTIESRIEQIIRAKQKLWGETVDQAVIKRELVMALASRENDWEHDGS